MTRSRKTLEILLEGTGIKFNGQESFDPQVHNKKFYDRILREGSLGLGESYMEGWWECEDLDIFFHRLFQADTEDKISKSLSLKIEILRAKFFNLQSIAKAKKSIHTHYDLGNELFRYMLDPLMMYSCAYWKGANNLQEAQEQKLKLICEKLKLQPGDTLLDIGCGWGGFAYYAAKNHEIKVVGITISKEQKKLAQKRCKDLEVEIRLEDYRSLNGKFDKIVSIGMLEHVGPTNYQLFMEIVKKNLKVDGLCLLHFIGGNETKLTTDQWIDRYIFPNGVIPSLQQVGRASEGKLVLEDLQNLGLHYDPTLISWQKNFNQHWDKLKSDYNTSFFRMWNYYLSSCAAAFRARKLNLLQLVFIHPEFPTEYKPVRF